MTPHLKKYTSIFRYWESASSYPQAAEDLASLLGDAVGLCSDDVVLGEACLVDASR